MKKTLIVIMSLAFLANLVFSTPTFAACQQDTLGIPHWYRGIVDGECEVIGPDKDDKFVYKIVLNVSEMLFRAVVLISFGTILYAGFRYITSAGSAQGVESAKKTLQNSVIGLIIALVATMIVNLIFGIIT